MLVDDAHYTREATVESDRDLVVDLYDTFPTSTIVAYFVALDGSRHDGESVTIKGRLGQFAGVPGVIPPDDAIDDHFRIGTVPGDGGTFLPTITSTVSAGERSLGDSVWSDRCKRLCGGYRIGGRVSFSNLCMRRLRIAR